MNNTIFDRPPGISKLMVRAYLAGSLFGLGIGVFVGHFFM